MLTKAKKCPVFLFLFLLFLSSSLVSQAFKPPYSRTDLDRCTISCRETEEEISELFRCVAGCEIKYRDEEWGERGESSSESTGSKEFDPKIEKCHQRCRHEEIEPRQMQQCQEKCLGWDKTEPQQRNHVAEDPEQEQQLEKCLEMCQKRPGKQKKVCQKRFKRQYEEKGEAKRVRSDKTTTEEEQSDNPYHYHSQEFESRFKTQDGSFEVLEDFSQRSPILRGIENYRLAILKANPNTFLVPHHWMQTQFFLSSKGIITLVEGEKRVSHNLEIGDVMMVSAGTTMYLINQEDDQIFRTGFLIQPISNIPGKFWEYFAAGGENTKSYYSIFSNGILETAFATPRDELERLFGESRQGVIIKTPQEKLKILSKGAISGKEREKDSKSPFNLLKRKPTYSNEFGSFHEASPNEYKQLQNLGISIGLAEMKKGVLMMPHYNSRTTYIIIVAEGSGEIEMGCPHLGRIQGKTGQYKKIRSQLSKGDVIIIPASHPFALLASPNETMSAVGFGINAQNNERNFLAGRRNIMHQIESVAREISFNAPDELVEKVLKNQKEPFFCAALGEEARI